jgi:xanthine dehydrogenase YagS FAD-binding subunit
MKTFTNANAKDFKHAASLAQQATHDGKTVAISSGGSDLLQLVKERTLAPDVIVNLRSIKGADEIKPSGGGLHIGGMITLDALSRNPQVRRDYAVLAEAAESVATPQIRNFGTLAGNVCQRPWCWYFRNGFKCYKAGGNQCFSVTGENQFHAIFGGGPSFIVHPSDTAPALVALDAKFRITGPKGERTIPAAEFFLLPKQDAAKENVLATDEVLSAIELPAPRQGTKSTYHKVLDREAWTHAVVSAAVVLELDRDSVCRSARVVLGGVAPAPWRVKDAETLLVGQKVTADLAAKAGQAAIAGATPLAKNGYKVALTSNVVERTVSGLIGLV